MILLRSKAGLLQYQHGEGDTPGEGEEAREEPTSKISSLGRYVFGSEISYNKAPPRLPGLGC